MSSLKSKVRSDRCANPFQEDGHIGKELRKISKLMLKEFSNLHENSKICKMCRIRFSQNCVSALSTDNLNNVVSSDTDYSDVDDNDSPKKKCYSRQDELEEMLNGLKDKYSSLDVNDPHRIMILTIAPECWSARRIANEFGSSRRMAKKAKNLRKLEGVLAMPALKTRKCLPDATKKKVNEFYLNDIYSRIMPHKKECVNVIIDGRKEKIQKRLLLCDITSLHRQFKDENPEHPIGLTKFAELRPTNCIIAGANGTHNVCVCTIHQNFKMMFDAANISRLTNDHETKLTDYKDCFQLIICKVPTDACYLRECHQCPSIDVFSDYLTEILTERGTSEIIFSTWQSTDRCTLKKECLSTQEFILEMCNSLEMLLPHHFISKNQSKYVSDRKNNLQQDEVLVQCDFSENYAYVAQDAAQAFHYNNDQCTVHPVVFYYVNNKNEIVHQSLILLSDSTSHDTAAVRVMQELLIPEIKKVRPNVKKIIYSTDGAKQHYKNKFQMINLVYHKEDFGIEAEWHYHATSHGKGACDGLGAILKREATRASLQAKPTESILNSTDLYNWAKGKFKDIKIFYYDKQKHKKMQEHLRKRFSTAPDVKKIQSCHAFYVLPNKKLQVMRFSGATVPINTVEY